MLVTHLFHHPHLIDPVAQIIFHEFWVNVEDGMTIDDLVAHLQTATKPQQIPLSLIALVNGQLAGTVNLIENDDAKRAHLRPWLAAIVVRADLRGQGVGTALVKALLADAKLMNIPTVYFGTDGPGFYQRLGAVKHEDVRDDFAIMKFELASLTLPPKGGLE